MTSLHSTRVFCILIIIIGNADLFTFGLSVSTPPLPSVLVETLSTTVQPLKDITPPHIVAPAPVLRASADEALAVNVTTTAQPFVDPDDEGWVIENKEEPDTRRILHSKTVKPGKRPYMVYLQLTKNSAKIHKYKGWLCGGVIIHHSYVLTSAACVEDADRFYIVSGTTKYVDSADYKTNECVCRNRRKAVWKCIPKNYKFDFQDSIKWSSNDIAIVKVNRKFKFNRLEKGCEFCAAPIRYNNVSRECEQAGTKAFIAGWGSVGKFREGVYRRQIQPQNSKTLQEAKVCVMDNELCAKKWAQKFRAIIQQYMICTKDVVKELSEICDKRYANCTELDDSRRQNDPGNLTDPELNLVKVDLGRHLKEPDDDTARRFSSGGFCENDHGGPLIVKAENKELVIGVISACKIDPKTHSCHGPFLYTSVFKNRQFISCAINKEVEDGCRRVFRTGITHEEYDVDWTGIEEDDEYVPPKGEKKEDEDDDGDIPHKKKERKVDSSDEDKKNDSDSENRSDIESTTAKLQKKATSVAEADSDKDSDDDK